MADLKAIKEYENLAKIRERGGVGAKESDHNLEKLKEDENFLTDLERK